ncbi:class I SAM-dependent methyltransferase [Dyadobacter diqingensis]|uniref:class I SAM-dependent methyltransferase n=1 Tax=Dyadobacter diqingensis TaxID=2938121 RepID=UPI0020C18E89|nr:class I SAM-dependent methyltransferase [Dyadobacter diqingensis]
MAECKVCNSISSGKNYSVREMMFGTKEQFEYFECQNCGCLQLEKIPDDIAKYYNSDNYYSFTHRKNGLFYWLKRERTKYYLYGSSIIGKILKNKYPNLSFEAVAKLSPDKTTRILDVGCGDGELLYMLSSIGFKNLLGIDPFIAKDVHFDTGLEVKKQSIHELHDKEKWDIIMLHHVFEHVPDPLETLRSIKKLLSPSGVAMIRIPTSSSYAWKHFRENWFQIDAPRHSFLHSIESMLLLVDQSGLKVNRYYYDSDEKQFWASEQYKKDIPLLSEKSYAKNPKDSMFNAEQIQNFKQRSEKLNLENQGDQVVFILESRSE